MYLEEVQPDVEPERIIAAPPATSEYRVVRAKFLAGLVRELLDRACMETHPGQTAWVKLERPEDDVYAKACWEEDLMATVWVKERGDVFRHGPAHSMVAWQERVGGHFTVTVVLQAVENLEMEGRQAILRDKLGWDANGLQFEGFFALKGILDALALPMRQLGKLIVMPEAEAESMLRIEC